MIFYSFKDNAFFDSEIHATEVIPDDVVEVPEGRHLDLVAARNSECIILSDLSVSEPKPSIFHKLNGTSWVDNRTEAEIKQQQREAMLNLSPIEFEIKLYKAGLYDEVRSYIDNDASVPMKIAYNRATFFNRTDSFITTAMQDLNLTDEQVDAIWNA